MDSVFNEFARDGQFYNFEYHALLQDILTDAEETTNQRTKTKIKALPNRIISYPILSTIPLINTRKMFPVSAFAELCWTLSGNRDLSWLQQHTKMWNDFANEHNEVEAAYGYRWRHMFGRDQLLSAIEALKADSSDRQIFISAWDNSKDGLGNRWTSNVPCPTCFSINIINNKLNLALFLRSSDTIVGLPYDMLMYSLLLLVIANELKQTYPKLQTGNIGAILAHAHIYESHYDIAQNLIANAKEKNGNYIVQDIDLNNCAALWHLQTVTNIINDPDTAIAIFKACIDMQYEKIKKFPPVYKPEIIK